MFYFGLGSTISVWNECYYAVHALSFFFFFVQLVHLSNKILYVILLKINIFWSAMFYYVIVTSYVDRLSWFWYQCKEETLPYTMVPTKYTLGVSILKLLQGVVTTALRKTCYKKGLGRRGLKGCNKQFKETVGSYTMLKTACWKRSRCLFSWEMKTNVTQPYEGNLQIMFVLTCITTQLSFKVFKRMRYAFLQK